MLSDLTSGIKKRILPEDFDFGMPSVELIGAYSKGLHKEAMQKRASAFDAVLAELKPRKNREYLHVITTGAYEKYGCFPADTLVGTAKGLVPISSIAEGDEVCTLDGKTGRVISTYRRLYTGNFVDVYSACFPYPVSMTDNHPVYVLRREDADKEYDANDVLEKAEASTIRENDYLFVPDPVIESDEYCDEDLRYAYIYGLYLAMGHVSYQSKLKKNAVVMHSGRVEFLFPVSVMDYVSPSEDKVQTVLKRVRSFASDFLGDPCDSVEKDGFLRVSIRSTALASMLLTEFGGTEYTRSCLSAVMKRKSVRWTEELLSGYMDGVFCSMRYTGNVSSSRFICVHPILSLSLATDMQRLLAMFGVMAIIPEPEESNYSVFNRKPRYTLEIQTANLDNVIKHSVCRSCFRAEKQTRSVLSRRNIKGGTLYLVTECFLRRVSNVEVFNLEVDGTHSYMVPFAVANCNSNGDAWLGDEYTVDVPYPKNASCKTVHITEGLKQRHDSTYMKDGAVYQEHHTARDSNPVEASGEIIAAKYNEPMARGELIIAVDPNKWARRLEKKARGQDIYLSVGCDVACDYCSICGNKATKPGEYCSHIKRAKLQLTDTGDRVCMLNEKPSFYDISGVDVPADKMAYVLRKIASGSNLKTAMYEGRSIMTRKPIPLNKAAAILDKLARMEKEILCKLDGPEDVPDELFLEDESDLQDFIHRVENYPVDEVLSGCNGKGILLSPELFFKLIGRDLPGKGFDDMGDDCLCGSHGVMEEMQDDPEFADNLMDGSFDTVTPADLSLDSILESFVPALAMTRPAVNSRSIMIIVKGGTKSPERHKKASENQDITKLLKRAYARYVIGFAARNNEDTVRFALRKLAAYSRI